MLNAGRRSLVAKSCAECGELKLAREFWRTNNGYYHAWCKRCQHLSAKNSDVRRNAESQDNARNRGNPWTETEIKELKQHIEEGLSGRDIASTMGRSVASINVAKSRYVNEGVPANVPIKKAAPAPKKHPFICKWCKVPVVSRADTRAILGREHSKHCRRRNR